MSDTPELNVWRDANDAFSLGTPGKREQSAAAVIRSYGDQRDAEAYQRGKLEGARLALEAVLPEVVTDRTIDAHGAHCRCTTCELNISEDGIRALSPAKIVGEG